MGSKQLGFGVYEQTSAMNRTRREKFLAEMDAVGPWQALTTLVEIYCPKPGTKVGRPPYPLSTINGST
jgi:transposase, IS5 family